VGSWALSDRWLATRGKGKERQFCSQPLMVGNRAYSRGLTCGSGSMEAGGHQRDGREKKKRKQKRGTTANRGGKRAVGIGKVRSNRREGRRGVKGGKFERNSVHGRESGEQAIWQPVTDKGEKVRVTEGHFYH